MDSNRSWSYHFVVASGNKRKLKIYDSSCGIYKINKKKINIYDSNDNLVFETYGTFNEICQTYNLPFTALKNSYLRNEKIYQKIGSNMSRLEKNGYIQYVGWYAKIID